MPGDKAAMGSGKSIQSSTVPKSREAARAAKQQAREEKPPLQHSWLWTSQPARNVEYRKDERWQESTADVGELYATGIHQIGRLFFAMDDELQDEHARFAGVSTRTDADAIVKLLLSYWRIQVPSVLLTVSGSAQAMDLEPRLENMLRDGIDSAGQEH